MLSYRVNERYHWSWVTFCDTTLSTRVCCTVSIGIEGVFNWCGPLVLAFNVVQMKLSAANERFYAKEERHMNIREFPNRLR